MPSFYYESAGYGVLHTLISSTRIIRCMPCALQPVRKEVREVRRNQKGNNKRRSGRHVQRLVDTIREHKIEMVATDLDGTVYSFWDYFVPAMQKAVPQIAETLGLKTQDYDRISQEIGRVMGRHGTHEYPWALEESWLRQSFRGTAVEFRDTLVRPFWAAMDRYRTKYLRPYADVRETLQTLHQAGIPVVGISDAPAYMAIVRLSQTGLDELVTALYALDTVHPEPNTTLSEEDLEHGKNRVREFGNTPHRLDLFKILPKSFEKPSPEGLKLAMSDFNIKDPRKVLMVGDSLTKDGGVAKAVGCPYIWARYGTNLPRGYVELIDIKFNPNASGTANVSGHGVSHKPVVLPPMVSQGASYAEVLKHLGLGQLDSSGTILPPSASPNGTKEPGH